MKINFNRYLSILMITCASFFVEASNEQAEKFIEELKTHYQQSPSLEVFSLNYHYLGRSPFYAWDYQAPERYLAIRMVEIDLIKKQFVENDVHHFSGGRTFNRVQFQDDKRSLFYDKNGLALGKRIIKQSMDTYQELEGHIFINIDFMVVKSLLETPNLSKVAHFYQNQKTGLKSLTLTTPDNNLIEYTFGNNPVQLASINNKSQQKKYVYADYQTSNGITFARSIHKYFGNVTKPSFVHRIDSLNIIEEIEPSKFKVPEDFGPIIPKHDKSLIAKEIAADLFLITDLSASRNILFKVNNDEIMVLGAPISPEFAEKTIKTIKAKFPKKTISSVYVTHPHGDHIAGLWAYAKRGVTILADAYTVSAIKAYPYFSQDMAKFKFKIISHEETVKGADFYVLENSHSKRQSFVHFPKSGIIYQADFLEVAFDNTIPKVIPSYTKTFIDFVRSKQLTINRIVGHHRNNNISLSVMNKTYNAIL
ncbi:hypothetical protein KO527_22045 [Pseudoalteromonas sp. C2R02]|uniref:hypothetical protein n=1 Tax=Pseudoalteromonas sp. C2R02 TaxID=2841565 RepID=UPI001C085E9B|nr:hypothetical protein [Pseudoalteromonas sp. C2R02]MBU2972023.1 hypothetical protein [Pseudoalteromonas sp. C2R02]